MKLVFYFILALSIHQSIYTETLINGILNQDNTLLRTGGSKPGTDINLFFFYDLKKETYVKQWFSENLGKICGSYNLTFRFFGYKEGYEKWFDKLREVIDFNHKIIQDQSSLIQNTLLIRPNFFYYDLEEALSRSYGVQDSLVSIIVVDKEFKVLRTFDSKSIKIETLFEYLDSL